MSDTISQTIIECEFCNGKGKLAKLNYEGTRVMGFYSCPVCGGTGQHEIEDLDDCSTPTNEGGL